MISLSYLTKVAPDAIKDIDSNKRTIVAYPSVFDNKDEGNDIVRSGAFTRTINSRGPLGTNKIKVLAFHDPTRIIGKPLVLAEDKIGLRTESHISDTALGNDILTLIQDEVITDLSIGYDIVKSQPINGSNNLLELKLFEYSFVTWGMNELAFIEGLKGSAAHSLIEQMKRAEGCLKNATWATDEVPEMLSILLKQWLPIVEKYELSTKSQEPQKIIIETGVKAGRTLSSSNTEKILAATESLLDLLVSADPDSANQLLEKYRTDSDLVQRASLLDSDSDKQKSNLINQLKDFTLEQQENSLLKALGDFKWTQV